MLQLVAKYSHFWQLSMSAYFRLMPAQDIHSSEQRGVGMGGCEWFPLSHEQILAWLQRHPEALPRTLSDLAAFPMAFRRVMLNKVAPDTRTALWREHLEACLATDKPWSDAQRLSIEATIPRLPELLAAPGPNPVIVAWEQEMSKLFSRQEASMLFGRIGAPEPPQGLPLPPDCFPAA